MKTRMKTCEEMIEATYARRRRTQRSNRIVSSGTRAALYLGSGGLCEWCGTRLTDGWHVDHLVAAIRGGGDEMHNLRASCMTCTRQKGMQSPEVFGMFVSQDLI